MKFKTITKEELELMSFDDIAYVILKEKGKKMKINDIFRIICDVLDLGESVYENQIADFFTLLATEKRFLQLEKGYWDLKENHTINVKMDEEDDDVIDDEIQQNDYDDDSDDNNEKSYDEIKEDDDDTDDDDDLSGLVIMDENDEDSPE